MESWLLAACTEALAAGEPAGGGLLHRQAPGPEQLWSLGLVRGRRPRVGAAPRGWGSGTALELPGKQDVIPGRWARSESWRVRCPGKGWQSCGVRQAFGTGKRHGWDGGFARFWQDRGAS